MMGNDPHESRLYVPLVWLQRGGDAKLLELVVDETLDARILAGEVVINDSSASKV